MRSGMKRNIFAVLLSLILLLALLPTAALADAPGNAPVQVTIFATNDLHGNVEHSDGVIGLAQTAAIKAATPGALLADAGDATQGASFATVGLGENVIELMNAAGYDVMAAGNHEFDYGRDRLLANAAAAKFPLLAANVNGLPLEGSCIKEANGKKIAFIGLTTTATATSTNPDQLGSITFADETAALRQELAAVSGQADAVILLCHLGDSAAAVDTTSQKLLDGLNVNELAQIAAVIDGHSHTTENWVYERTGTAIAIPVVQSGVNGAAISRVDLLFDGAAVSATASVMPYAEAMTYELNDAGRAAAQKVEQALQAIKTEQAATLDAALCENAAPLWGGYIYYDYVESRIVETAYGDFVTDAFAAKAAAFAKKNGLALPVVAVENGGGIGQTMPMGTVTRGDILTAFNHGNMVVVLAVTPAQLYEALEAGLTMTGQSDTGLLLRERVSGSFLQAGGFSYAYDPAAPTGSKVTEVALDGGIKLSKNDKTTRLLLATNNYVATFNGLKDGEKLGELGGEDLIVQEYLQASAKGGKLTYPLTQGRIRIAGDKSPATYDVAIPVLNAVDKTTPLPGQTVHLKIDDGSYTATTTGADGALAVKGLAKGPHQFFLQEAPGQAVYVNNYSGSGTVTTREGYYRLGFLVDDGLPFNDVPVGAWYREAVTYVYQNGLMQGANGRFEPQAAVTRAQMVTLLWNMQLKPVVNYSLNCPDVAEGAWYTEAIRWAVSEGVVSGYADGTFRPNAPITREQLAAMLYRYEQKYGDGGFTGNWQYQLPFSDLTAISDWAAEAVAWCNMHGVLQGQAGRFEPAGQTKRCELAQALTRYCQLDNE